MRKADFITAQILRLRAVRFFLTFRTLAESLVQSAPPGRLRIEDHEMP